MKIGEWWWNFWKVDDYLVNGDAKLLNIYHLLKTNKIPNDIDDPTLFLEEKSFLSEALYQPKAHL